MLLFAKVMVVFVLAIALLKVAALGRNGPNDRGYTAFDLLLYGGLGLWGVFEWSRL